MYFGSFGRNDGMGGGDIYTSSKLANGTWSTPRHLGGEINTIYLDYSPYVSSDGRYLFFTSERASQSKKISTNPFDVSAVVNSLLTPGNAAGSDIYWIKR